MLPRPSPDDAGGGFIRVGVRVRPPLRAAEEATSMIVAEEEGTIAVRIEVAYKYETFAFASVHQSQDNEALFEAVGTPLLRSAIDGYNGTLLSYGQTGSGKTYTMGEVSRIGTADEGLAHRMVRGLFDAAARDAEHAYTFSIQYVQVYIEKVYDLLGARPKNKDSRDLREACEVALPLREDKRSGVHIHGCTTHPVRCMHIGRLRRMHIGRLRRMHVGRLRRMHVDGCTAHPVAATAGAGSDLISLMTTE